MILALEIELLELVFFDFFEFFSEESRILFKNGLLLFGFLVGVGLLGFFLFVSIVDVLGAVIAGGVSLGRVSSIEGGAGSFMLGHIDDFIFQDSIICF